MNGFETMKRAYNSVTSWGGLAVMACLAVGVARLSEYAPEEYIKNEALPANLLPLEAYDWVTPDPPSEDFEERVQVGRATMPSDTYRGQFTSYVEAKVGFNAKIDLLLVDITYDSSEAIKEGLIVNRIKLPGIPLLDTLSFSDGDLRVTQFKDGAEVGIDIGGAVFERLKPEVALDANGELTCPHEISDKDFSGCITADIQSAGFLSAIEHIGSDPQEKIRNSVNKAVEEYSKIEQCHFDQIIIPAMNAVYSTYNLPLIEGDGQYQEAMATLFRGLWRDGIKSSTPPHAVSFKIVGDFKPVEDIKTRFERLQKLVDFPFDTPDNYSRDYCAKGPNGTIPFEFSNIAGGFEEDIQYIAIMGLENVPEDYDPILKQFRVRKAVEETTIGVAA